MKNAPTFARVVNNFTTLPINKCAEKLRELRATIPGWSNVAHAAFFQAVARSIQPKARVLICGVYHGLDLALMEWAARDAKVEIELHGVDLFSDKPCADWTPEQKARGSWQANGFGPPPDIEAAKQNAPSAKITKMNAYVFMLQFPLLFDVIYLDTSHDEVTVGHEIGAAQKILAPGGIIAGDDYYEPNTHWGVDKAVQTALPHHVVLASRIWTSP